MENLFDEANKIIGTRFTIKVPQNLKTPEMVRQEWLETTPKDDEWIRCHDKR